MRIILSYVTGCALLACSTSARADCVDVIKASSLKGTVIEDSSQVAAQARNFCSEYASAKSAGKAFNGSLSYGGLGIGAGTSSSSLDQVASKYCDASNMSQAKSNYYEQYVETIAPGAFGSYNRCLSATANRLAANLDPNATHALDLTIVMSSKRNDSTGGQDRVQFIPSQGITCRWTNRGNATVQEDTVMLPANSSAGLFCTRQNASSEGSVTIVTATSPDANFAFLWKRYQDGLPINELQAIRDSNTQLMQSMAGAVLAFNATECPVGWRTAKSLAGRTILGAGAGNGLTARTLGQTGGEEEHTLSLAEIPSHTHSGNVSTGGHSYEHHQYNGRMPGERWQVNSGAAGGGQPHNNMPPFSVLLYCERI